jgi:hypothetical protein
MSNRRTALIIAIAIGLVLACGLSMLLVGWGFGVFIERSRNKRVHSKQELLTELNQIQPPTGAVTIHDDTVILKSTHALVGRDYSFDGTYEDIRKHYDTELRSMGWHFVEERRLKSWSEDLGERDFSYCKEGMWVEVFYNGSAASKAGSAYHVNVSSGLNDCRSADGN